MNILSNLSSLSNINNVTEHDNLIESPKKLTAESIAIAHIIVTTILIIYIIIPLFTLLNIKDDSLDLFNKQYTINYYKTIIITFFINYVYLKIADLIPGRIPKLYKRIVIILLFSVLINYYITYTPYDVGTIKFMKEWLKTIGWCGIGWDLIYINIIGMLADNINIYNLNETNIFNLLIYSIFTLFILHI
jgi:hypothetical protein